MSWLVGWFILFCVLGCSFVHSANYSGTDGPLEANFDYYSMPLLSEMDDFDLCLRKPDAVYCLVDVVIKEDDTPLYQFIKNFSSIYYKNYNHTKLNRGVCGSQRCILNASHADAGETTAEKLKVCLNATLYEGYGFQVDTSSVRYCKTQDNYILPDVLDYVIGGLILLLFLVNLGCTAYYFFFAKDNKSDNKMMLAFCVQKNWQILRQGIGDRENFKCFEALRFYTMVLVIGAHIAVFFGYGFTANSEFIEKSYDDFFGTSLLNLRVVLQIFFVMGGFLMAYNMLVYADTHQFSLKIGLRKIVNRWIRLMPIVLVVMGLSMTWVPHLGSGPMWDAVVKRERDMCRMNWWQLVILMPNLFPFEYLCMAQTWYIGADFQLFLVTMVVLLIIWRWPRSGIPVLSSVMVISLLIPFLQSYLMNLLPVRVSLYPESIRDLAFRNNDTFQLAYLSAQGNWAGYHLGVLTAYFYHRSQIKKWNFSNSFIMKILFLVSIPVAFGTIFMGWDLHNRKASAFESAVFNVLNQNFFALAICVFIIGNIFQLNRTYVNAVEWGPIQPLGRLSYCALFLHSIVLRTYGGQLRTTFYATGYTIIMLYAGIVISTYIWALPLYLFVEAPASQLQKVLLGPKRKPKDDYNIPNENQVNLRISNVSVSAMSTHV